jgi:protein-S-isoprenylcysteine O-methyltransferase Ste14
MQLKDRMINIIYSTAMGTNKKKLLLTPVFGTIFFLTTSLFVLIPLYIDWVFNIPKAIFQPLNYILSFLLILIGIFLVLWSVFHFIKVKGTPVPVNPPPRLISSGPYAYSRNPMTSGLFLQMFGIGIYFGSVLSVFVFTPVYILLHVIELKRVEEPELEKRLGEDYVDYKTRVPMFFPWRRNLPIHKQ